jgi:DNA polymerase delta subunit 1
MKVELKYKEQFRIFAQKDKLGMDQIMNYLLMDIYLPERFYDKLSMSVYLHTNASVMKTNPIQLYTEGQSIRCVCSLYANVVENGMYVNSRKIWNAGKYIGGLVFDQIAGIYEDVMTFDFTSLYPSEMNANNICYTSLINEEKDGSRYKDEDCHVVEGPVPIIDKKTREVIEIKNYRFRYIHKKTYKGLLPRIVVKLNQLRSEYKAEMDKNYGIAKGLKVKVEELKKQITELKSKITDNETQSASKEELEKLNIELKETIEKMNDAQMEGDIWNVKQMAVKVSANSQYGFMGMKTGKFSFIEGGMSTTIAGRGAISKALNIVITDFGAVLVYGDTDSVMVKFPEGFITRENFTEKAKMISAHISKKFHEQGQEEISMAWENYFLVFFTITKKRYAGIKIDRESPGKMPTEKEVKEKKLLYIRGLISVRGNSCGIVYKNFDPILIKMMLKIPIQDLFDHLHEMAKKIMRRDYELPDYTFSQRLGQNYKSLQSTMARFADNLRQQGRIHKPGEDLEYLYVKTYGECLKGFKMQAPDLFIENNNVLDTLLYVTNQIAKPVEQLLTCVYDDSVLKNYEKKIIRPKKPTAAQKVTPHWHLELYIRKYIAFIHKNWELVQDHIKCLSIIAERNNWLTYVHDDTTTTSEMKRRYGVDWIPVSKFDPFYKPKNGIRKEFTGSDYTIPKLIIE